MPRLARPVPVRSTRTTWLLGALLTFLVTSGCNCAIGEYSGPLDGNVPPDTGRPDTSMPDGNVEGGVDMGTPDAGNACGDGVIDSTEAGEVCDPGASSSFTDILRCICPSDGDNCTDDVWVPDPSRGVCYGSCQHPARSGYNVNSCDDSLSCTVDAIVGGSVANCDVICSNIPPSTTDTTCNGFDDDCNGLMDDGFVGGPSSCGLGVCASVGTQSCYMGAIVNTCTVGSPTGTDTNCNAIDEDCDGVADDGFTPTATTCGVGSCSAGGVLSCVSGNLVDSCSQTSPTGNDNNCNGADEDCDGNPDDGYVSTLTTCGLGVCASSGLETCNNGMLANSCMPLPPSGNDTNCNGLDEDCDGVADDGYVTTITSCGRGVCASAGLRSCVNGSVVDSCVAGSPTGTDTNCDGLDDDCDGVSDDGYQPTSVSCGLGVCTAGGIAFCVSGAIQSSCTPGTPTGTDQNCNGFDEDCDGVKDDGFQPAATSCGRGVCTAVGFSSCVNGALVDSCVAGSPTGNDTNCNGIDENCNGVADDGFVAYLSTCGQGVCRSSGVATCSGGTLLDTCTPTAATGTDTNCNGVDENCNGVADDGYVATVATCGTGVCASTGLTSCTGGVVSNSCVAGTATGTDTNCNGVDEDCDGVKDDGYVATSTACGVGACTANGLMTCSNGMLMDSCTSGATGGSDANCNGVDEDCNGVADDGFVPTTTTCGLGVCAATGITSCVSGSLRNSCTPLASTGTDQNCNGVDEDCDGTPDDGYAPTVTNCGQGVCASTGISSCVAGSVQSSCMPGPTQGNDTNCNGLDENCNGVNDDGYVAVATSCGLGVCVRSGVTSCVAGAVQDSCVAGTPTVNDTTCDGVDQDCDGVLDDAYVPTSTSCGQGVCARSGVTSCVGGAVQDSCVVGNPTGTDMNCNGSDEDCDGTPDDGYVPLATSCGAGVCARTGFTSCSLGSVRDSCTVGSPTGTDQNCNGSDEDCDGVADDGFASSLTLCGLGVCASTGITSCVSGSVQNSCTPGATTGTDQDCDGIDQDCDGIRDDGYVPVPTSCGQGVCAATGSTSCVNGSLQNSCTAGTATGTDQNCNGFDEDCDGVVDDGYVPVATSCGVGVCASTGLSSCVGGSVRDSCVAGATTGTDQNCNNLDEDCDGVKDDGYVPTSTSCGQGVCAASGVTSCVSGAVQNSCTPGASTGTDQNCNGLDENCNGVPDDGYVAVSTACGTGVCARTGMTSCVSGAVQNSCVAGTATGTDANCNGTDENCNGVADDGYVPMATTCGLGVCSASGVTSCVGGSVQNSCTPGTSTGTDQNCNGLDEDCDGAKDDGYMTTTTMCGTGVCARSGSTSCVGGVVQNSCVAGSPTGTDANCNGTDENCNGVADDNYMPTSTSCGMGACTATGLLTCVGGTTMNSCTSGASSGTDDNCNGIDEDCDGVADDNFVATPTSCGLGVCQRAGITSCINGVLGNSCVAGAATGTDQNCNGTDEDCDGTADDGYAPMATSCGQGVCVRSGITSCVAGTVQDSCMAGSPTGTDANCNGVDENCNGVKDDGYVAVTTSCGLGVCQRSGLTSCVNGAVQDSCVAGAATGTDTTCNNTDEDCDGVKDDGYLPQATSCGLGVCTKAGATSCVNGMVQDSCVAGSPTGTDQNCNNLDEDCDGTRDDGYLPEAITCGLGVCLRNGTTQCSGGTITPVCTAGSMTGTDQNCNGFDENCNGVADDGYVATTTTCGTGACARTGILQCSNGSTTDTCAQGSPTAEVCDALDNDCDGTVNNGNPQGGGACSTGLKGVCSAGTYECKTTDTTLFCKQNVTSSDEVCDSLDNNCNGQVNDGNPGGGATCTVFGKQGLCATGSTTCGPTDTSPVCNQLVFPVAETCGNTTDSDCNGNNDTGDVLTASESPVRWGNSCAASIAIATQQVGRGTTPSITGYIDSDAGGTDLEDYIVVEFMSPGNPGDKWAPTITISDNTLYWFTVESFSTCSAVTYTTLTAGPGTTTLTCSAPVTSWSMSYPATPNNAGGGNCVQNGIRLPCTDAQTRANYTKFIVHVRRKTPVPTLNTCTPYTLSFSNPI